MGQWIKTRQSGDPEEDLASRPDLSRSTEMRSVRHLQIPLLSYQFLLSSVRFPNVVSSSSYLGLRDAWFHLLPTCCDIIIQQSTQSPGRVESGKVEFGVNVKQTKARYFCASKDVSLGISYYNSTLTMSVLDRRLGSSLERELLHGVQTVSILSTSGK